MNHANSQQTLNVLANANELIRCVVQKVVGNDVADSLEGSPLTNAALYSLAQTGIQAELNPYLKKV